MRPGAGTLLGVGLGDLGTDGGLDPMRFGLPGLSIGVDEIVDSKTARC